MNLKNNPTFKSSQIKTRSNLKPKVKVGITMGDPSGVGPIIALKAINYLRGFADFVVIGDKWVFEKNQKFNFIDLNNVPHKNFSFGKIKAEYGRASLEYLDKALELIKLKEIDCLVTCPISKEAINLAGFNYGGHTEYFAKRFKIKDLVMMLVNNQLRISLATRHIPLKSVSSELKPDKLYKTILLTYRSLKKVFLIKSPRLIVCALNPHASDNGLMGNEENRIIKPVLNKLRGRIRYLDGPLPSDVAISKASQKEYDCAIAMYHDQALIPLKLSGNDTGVNMTLGLPFVRTSPLHGTAFDIAQYPSQVNPRSLIEAIRLAVKCTLNLRNA